MLSLFQRAWANMALTPAERTVLKAMALCAMAAGASVLTSVGQGRVDWHAALGAFLVAFLATASKWFTAHGDTQAAMLTGSLEQLAASRAGLPNDVVTELESTEPPPATPDTMAMARQDG